MLPPNGRTVKKLGHLLLVLALLGATGGHWAVLQTVAWANMLAANLQTDSVSTAISKTFDGNHPCKMCKRIQAGKKEEKKSELPAQVKKLEFIIDQPAFVFAAPLPFNYAPCLEFQLEGLAHRPAVPPPRLSV